MNKSCYRKVCFAHATARKMLPVVRTSVGSRDSGTTYYLHGLCHGLPTRVLLGERQAGRQAGRSILFICRLVRLLPHRRRLGHHCTVCTVLCYTAVRVGCLRNACFGQGSNRYSDDTPVYQTLFFCIYCTVPPMPDALHSWPGYSLFDLLDSSAKFGSAGQGRGRAVHPAALLPCTTLLRTPSLHVHSNKYPKFALFYFV